MVTTVPPARNTVPSERNTAGHISWVVLSHSWVGVLPIQNQVPLLYTSELGPGHVPELVSTVSTISASGGPGHVPELVSTVSTISASGGPGSRVHPSSSFRVSLSVPVGTQEDGPVISASWEFWELASINVPLGNTTL